MVVNFKVLIGFGVASILVMNSWPPSEVSLTKACDPKGVWSEISATAFGSYFWKKQQSALKGRLKESYEEPRLRAQRQYESDKTMREMDDKLSEIMAEAYRKNPNLRPTPSEQYVEALRDQADRIEYAELMATITAGQEKSRLKRIEWFERCQPIIQGRTR